MADASPYFIIGVVLEIVALAVQGRKHGKSIGDSITSLNNGSMMRVIATAFKGIDVMLYSLVYNKVRKTDQESHW